MSADPRMRIPQLPWYPCLVMNSVELVIHLENTYKYRECSVWRWWKRLKSPSQLLRHSKLEMTTGFSDRRLLHLPPRSLSWWVEMNRTVNSEVKPSGQAETSLKINRLPNVTNRQHNKVGTSLVSQVYLHWRSQSSVRVTRPSICRLFTQSPIII